MALTRGRPARWLLREPDSGVRTRLFCLPYSGCGASMYRAWPRVVDDVEICPVQPPGRENRFREKPFASLRELAQALAAGLLPYLDRPFAFFGHCSSALVAYETARHLDTAGFPRPARLYLSSQVAPHQGPHGRFLGLSRTELAAEVSGLLRGLGAPVRPDLVDITTEVLAADVAAHRAYGTAEPAPSPSPMSVIGWDADTEVPYDLIKGWSDLGDCEFHVLPGPHYAFMAAPPELLRVLADGLRDVGTREVKRGPGTD